MTTATNSDQETGVAPPITLWYHAPSTESVSLLPTDIVNKVRIHNKCKASGPCAITILTSITIMQGDKWYQKPHLLSTCFNVMFLL